MSEEPQSIALSATPLPVEHAIQQGWKRRAYLGFGRSARQLTRVYQRIEMDVGVLVMLAERKERLSQRPHVLQSEAGWCFEWQPKLSGLVNGPLILLECLLERIQRLEGRPFWDIHPLGAELGCCCAGLVVFVCGFDGIPGSVIWQLNAPSSQSHDLRAAFMLVNVLV
jgi:hypothetical protein